MSSKWANLGKKAVKIDRLFYFLIKRLHFVLITFQKDISSNTAKFLPYVDKDQQN